MTVSDHRETLRPDTDERIELVGTAIANAESRSAPCRLVEEQAALRRVATQVARGLSPEEIFNAVSNEVSRLLGCEQAVVERFEAGGSELTIVGASEGSWIGSIGDRWVLEDFLASTAVHRTGRPARIDLAGARNASGPVADRVREIGFISSVATPIVADGSLWGVITVADTKADLPPDTEARLEHFAELVATAIATADSRADLAGSEARALDLAREQTALRRVATLVAEGTNARDLFAAVTQEVANLCGIPVVGLHRFESDGTFTMMGIAGETNHNVGDRRPVEDVALATMILATRRPAHKEYDTAMLDPLGAVLKAEAIGVPILVDGSLWGFIVIAGKPGDHLPGHTEERLARFTELIATAIADSQAREHVAQLAEEQAALRRVATLVARGVSPDEIFSAVSNEVGRLFDSNQAAVARYERDGSGMVVVGASEGILGVSIGTRWPLEDFLAATAIHRTGRPTRKERSDFEAATGRIGDTLREINAVSSVSAPIVVEGDVWGVMAVSDMHKRMPPDAEERLQKFTELVGTAIANAASRGALAASRARIVAAADESRRRIQRDLHDGAQQRIVHAVIVLKIALEALRTGDATAGQLVAEGLRQAEQANLELRELAHGILPAALTRGGLGSAVQSLVSRISLPVSVEVSVEHRLPAAVEATAYFIVSEALTNVVKHARANRATVTAQAEREILVVEIRDDGIGGADPGRGSGLVGLSDRAQAMGGTLKVTSPAGKGTALLVEIPLAGQNSEELPERP
jgi:signal transduction histidine kinase